MAVSASRTLSGARASARNRKPKLRDCIEPRRERRRLWFCGSSAIIDPRGVVIAAASPDREELIHADLSQELVRSVRRRVKLVRSSPRRFTLRYREPMPAGERDRYFITRCIAPTVEREPLRRVFTTTEEALLESSYFLAVAFDSAN